MMVASSINGSNYRLPVLFRIAYLVLSLAPSVIGPPERNFTQDGQPELQQIMDNMAPHVPFMKRFLQLPSDDGTNLLPSLLTEKTTHLLKEAERMLNTSTDLKEKVWMETFIHKLHHLTSTLEEDAANETSENEPQNGTAQVIAQSLNKTTVPEYRSPPQSSVTNQMTSNLPVSRPENNQEKPIVNDAVDHQVVKTPEPASVEISDEDDELVRELENLHKVVPPDHSQQSVQIPQSIPNVSAGDTSRETSTQENKIAIAKEKEILKERLVEEVSELKRLGETEEEILNVLHIHGFKVDSRHPNAVSQQSNFEEGNESPEKMSVKRVEDIERNKNRIPKVDPNSWNLPALQAADSPRQIYLNNTFLGMHITLPPMSPRVLRRQLHYGLHRNSAANTFPFYHGNLKDTIQKFQAYNNQNLIMRNHMLNLQQRRPNVLAEMNTNAISHDQYPRDNPAFAQYPKLNNNPIYMPYPFFQNLEQKNHVSNATQPTLTAYSTNSLPNYNISEEFNDEMKRQLRDGKVILLSDSVVRSNFPPDSENINPTTPKSGKEKQ